MASYRDQHNPEALHFLGSAASKSFLALTILICLLLIIWAAVSGGTLSAMLNLLMALLVIAASAAAWPKSILVDQRGLTQHHGTRKRLLEWSDAGAAELSSEFLLPLRSGRFPTRTLRITSKDGKTKVVHTPRHTDFHRFAFEIQRHGVKLPAELGTVTAPNLSRLTSAKEPMPDGLRRR